MKTVQQFKFITFNYIVYYTFPYFLIILILYRLAKEFSNKSLGLDDLMSSSSWCLKNFLFIIDGQKFKNNEFRFKGGVIWLVIWGFCCLYCSSFILSEVFQTWNFGLISFIVFEKFLVIMSSNISSALFSTFFFLWDSSYVYFCLS